MNHTKNPKIAFIKTCWHSEIVSRCEDGFMAEFDHRGWSTDGVEIIEVPGALEIPLLAKKLSKTGTFEAIIAAGLVVDGGIFTNVSYSRNLVLLVFLRRDTFEAF